MLVLVKPEVRGVLIGTRYLTHQDGPVDVEAHRAADVIKQGFAEAVVAKVPTIRAVEPRASASRRSLS